MTRTGELLELVLPVYNEAHVLEASVRRVLEAGREWKSFAWRILIVDNGSIDATPDVGRRIDRESPEVRFVRLERKGRGHALRKAWSETDAPYSLYMDVDLSTGLEAVPAALHELISGADIVAGSRLHRDSRVRRSLKREIFSRGYNALVRAFFWRRSFVDAQCGFKGIRVAAVRPLIPLVRNDHWFFDTELMLLAEYAGLRVRSLPVVWVEDLDTRVVIPQYVMENLRGLVRLRLTIAGRVRELRR